MRISDWSSDVCSSDIAGAQARIAQVVQDAGIGGRKLRGLFQIVRGRDKVALRTRQQAKAVPAFGGLAGFQQGLVGRLRSEEHTSALQSLMSISYAVFCLNKKQVRHIDT